MSDDIKAALKDLREVSSEELKEQIDALNEALEASKSSPPTYGVALQVNDLSEIAKKYLSTSARYDMSNRAKQLVIKYDDGRCYVPAYFSVVVKTGNEELGVKEIAKILNSLSQEGLIHSSLAPMSSLQLALTSSVPKSVVFAFPHVPENVLKDIQVKYKEYFTLEGGIGPDLEDTSVPLADGEFIANIRIQAWSVMSSNVSDKNEILELEIQEYLKYLPEGTEVVKKTELAISSLSYEFEVIFRHPEMYDISKIDLNYVRCVRPLEEGKLEQYNRFIGLRYFDRSGKELYNYK